ncbi:TPM domain-containing protein [Parasedimentitalea huanghaiensis]|uniref:TPM domain-containing protein n=1 Tax=Parasedimentitalea huanghaiensis TaxID=2682100 RepID=A0A6L6WLD9_9RHOB|nr:TPM domain-containing protein [Zongyanglinia huanghaiensis]MVO17809.1 hypothetical protein [Zongyanglinia huanghaiensis]
MKILKLLILAVAVMAAGNSAHAQSYPNYQEVFVNDYVGILSTEETQRLRSKLQTLRAVHDIEFTTVTINRMSDYGHSGPIEPFATGLFNHWGVGNVVRDDGVMLLVARYDRKMRIEVGSGYGTSKNAAMAEIIQDVILPEFRKDNYAAGILKGVDEVINELTGAYPNESDSNALGRAWKKLERFAERNVIAVLVAISGVGLFLVSAGRWWFRNRPRYCPVDRNKMIRLTEQLEDAHLDDGQQTEERLKSKDYDVWDCPNCNHVTIEGYRGWFSRMGGCRSCGYKTLQGDTTILIHATTSSTGLKRIDYHCHHCADKYSATKTIPKKSSSSSSSSSFGGGSSSGGGASGSW